MQQTFLRALALSSIVGALLLGSGTRAAMAEDDEGPEATGIEWVEGWEAGQAQAKKDGKLIFLYFGRHAPR